MKQSSASSSPISISDLYEIYKSSTQVQTDTRQLKKAIYILHSRALILMEMNLPFKH